MVNKLKDILVRCRISPEGAETILIVFGAVLILSFVFPAFFFLFFGFFCFIVFTFRDPVRIPSNVPNVVYSPADGVVADIEEVWLKENSQEKYIRIGIFLSLFDVHVQRTPYSGTVLDVKHKQGRKYPAFDNKAKEHNESNTIAIETKKGKIIVKQLAGLVTRRIICLLKPLQEVSTGDRLGVILFGSRVELYVPSNIIIKVKLGDRVKATETILAEFD